MRFAEAAATQRADGHAVRLPRTAWPHRPAVEVGLPCLALMLLAPGPAHAAQTQTAVLAGGCFWGVESVFEHVAGVRNVISGYAGGSRGGFGTYGGQRTDFVEAVRITYDPAQISYDQLLQIFFDVAHDPTQVDRQGPDVGPRYRSAILPQNAEQRAAAQRYLSRLRSAARGRPIATRIETGPFEVAEPKHQDFVRKHPRTPYVVRYDLPKLVQLRRQFPQLWRG